jgi:fatty-acyl-CoA synthase
MGNEEWFFDVYWGAMRTGLYFTPINWHLQQNEIRYIVENCDARVLVTSAHFADVAAAITADAPRLQHKLVFGGDIEGFTRAEALLAQIPEDAPLEDAREGALMLYSSGTTGYPKGVRQPLPGAPAGDPKTVIAYTALPVIFGVTDEDRYLSPAPLYHAAPLIFTTSFQRVGVTTVIMRKFDPEDALRMIQDQRSPRRSGCPRISAGCSSSQKKCATATT